MTGVEAALLLFALGMTVSSGWVWKKTGSSLLILVTVMAWIGLAYVAGLLN